ncbi:hypothetical protein Bca52824_011131 [Brassica carinata]|uniref:Uncharacterized protein n=1 Tax=Brassica carinata TaxID=52824 RepID=A0A8X8BBI4_BRACI|nr:hypothetical protein Bca52824_011131 [Brassica carinata]
MVAGVATVSGGRVTVAEGDLSSFSFTEINGGETLFGFDDHRPRYGHRGSGVASCCKLVWSPVMTSEDLDPSPVLLVLLGSSGSRGERREGWSKEISRRSEVRLVATRRHRRRLQEVDRRNSKLESGFRLCVRRVGARTSYTLKI